MLLLKFTPLAERHQNPKWRPQGVVEWSAYIDSIEIPPKSPMWTSFQDPIYFVERDNKDAELIRAFAAQMVEKLRNLPTRFVLNPLPPVVDQGALGSSSACGIHAGMSSYRSALRMVGDPVCVKSRRLDSLPKFFIDMEKHLDSIPSRYRVKDADIES